MGRSIPLFLTSLVLLCSCGVPADDSGQTIAPTNRVAIPTTSVTDAFRQDAETLANDMGISVDDAIHRLHIQDEIGMLGAALQQHEADTFAGLWVQHEPVYRVVVAFTRNGPETIRRHVAHTPLADVIEVRSAAATYAELMAVQQQTQQLLNGVGLFVTSAINIQQNQVEVYVTDRALFDTTLQTTNIQLPDHVKAITVYEPLGSSIPFTITPEPAIVFPQLKMRSVVFMSALVTGELVVQQGCLRVSASGSMSSHLVIWQPDYFLNNHNGMIEILDRNGAVVARVGEQIHVGGGEVALTADLEGQLREQIPKQCKGPYWLMGEVSTPK